MRKKKKRYLIYCEEDDCLLKTETRRLCSPSARNTSVRKLNSALSVNDDESVTSLDLGSQISVNEWPAQISPAGMAPCPAQPLWVGPVSFGRSQQSHPLCEDVEPGPRQGLQKDTQVTPIPGCSSWAEDTGTKLTNKLGFGPSLVNGMNRLMRWTRWRINVSKYNTSYSFPSYSLLNPHTTAQNK